MSRCWCLSEAGGTVDVVDSTLPDAGRPEANAAVPAASAAPYSAGPVPARDVLDPRRPWREAGRSHLAAAAQLRRDNRARSGLLASWSASPEISALRARADAAQTTARNLAALTSTGWVVLHDRVLADTSTVIDHVLIGPPGVVVIQDRPTRGAGYDPAGLPWADGVPLAAEREQVRWTMQEVLRRTVDQLASGWYVWVYPLLVLHGPKTWAPDLTAPCGLITPQHLRWAIGTYSPSLAPLHVTDLAYVVEDICPPAPLGGGHGVN